MMALLLAAHLGAAAALPPKAYASKEALGPLGATCRAGGVTEAASAGKARLWKLGELPKAHMEIAINRTIGGCPAPLIVRYDADLNDRPTARAGG
jgi:hypothetical protein